MKDKNTLLYVIIGLLIVIIIVRVIVLIDLKNDSASSGVSHTTTADTDQSAFNPTAPDVSAIALHSLKTISTEWGEGDANYFEVFVDDYYGNEYYGYYDFAALDCPYPTFKESYVRIAAKGEWRTLSGTYFPRPWESGDYYVRLSVYADDDLVYRGDWMTLESKPVSFSVNIRNCDVLKIVVDSQKTESNPYITPGLILADATVSKR